MSHRDRFAIVGAGFSGLGVAGALLRHGIPFDLLEADDDIGGNWYHGVYETVHIISSRRTTELADFPMPPDWPDFPSADQMLAYLRAYADHIGVRERVETNTRVTRVHEVDGGWEVCIEGAPPRTYRGVVIANGHHRDRRWPSYPGTFDGEILHSRDYRRPEQLAGQRVLVIGGGNSACDIAVEAARFGASSHLSLRRGYWFLPRTLLGVPTVELLHPWMPVPAQRLAMRALLRVVVGRYESYGLPRPDHRLFEKHPTVNDALLHALRNGQVTPHPDVDRYDGDHVVFTDGARVPVDLVVCATGFHASVPMLDDGVLPYRRGVPQLVGGMLVPGRRHLYVFGMSQPRYGAGPLVSASAELLATMIRTQERMDRPLADVLARLGVRPPDTLLTDPHKAMRQARWARRVVPRLPRVARWI